MIIRLTSSSGHQEWDSTSAVFKDLDISSFVEGSYGRKLANWLIDCERLKKDHSQLQLRSSEGGVHTFEWHDFRQIKR